MYLRTLFLVLTLGAECSFTRELERRRETLDTGAMQSTRMSIVNHLTGRGS